MKAWRPFQIKKVLRVIFYGVHLRLRYFSTQYSSKLVHRGIGWVVLKEYLCVLEEQEKE